ncbi:hypothetical protein ASZ90_007385 [hydrocarbon metagenome]|uniref:DUF6160 domain-containing protein n=1 Tax=hydrocarbon metagenome TaxID=938273 RepID=A0A0W8FPY2_9ZZZZ
MKKILLLLCFAAIAFIPLGVKAEMQAMTDSEMQVVSGQVSIAGLIGTGDGIFRCTTLKMGLSPATVYILGTTVATPLTNNALMTVLQPVFVTLVNFQIPQDILKALSTIN